MMYLRKFPLVEEDERLFQEGKTKEGEIVRITKCYNEEDILVRFLDANFAEVKTTYSDFLKGNIKNPKKPTNGYHGYVSKGKYTRYIIIDGKRKMNPAYRLWKKIHEKAYNYLGKYPEFANVEVAEEWWDYQNFAKWYYDNSYKVNDENMCLNKNILKPGSNLYGPETCILLPSIINEVFNPGGWKNKNGKNIPMGVTMRKDKGKIKYRARCNVRIRTGQYLIIGKTFDTIPEATKFYRETKEEYIKDVANEYKDVLPKHIYNALINYRIPEYKCIG